MHNRLCVCVCVFVFLDKCMQRWKLIESSVCRNRWKDRKPQKTEINYQSYQLLTKSFVFGSLENIFQKYVAWIIACRLRSFAFSLTPLLTLQPSPNCHHRGRRFNEFTFTLDDGKAVCFERIRAADFSAYVLIKCIFSNHIGIYIMFVQSISFLMEMGRRTTRRSSESKQAGERERVRKRERKGGKKQHSIHIKRSPHTSKPRRNFHSDCKWWRIWKWWIVCILYVHEERVWFTGALKIENLPRQNGSVYRIWPKPLI